MFQIAYGQGFMAVLSCFWGVIYKLGLMYLELLISIMHVQLDSSVK
jgi:hypothetical protein